MSTQNTEMVRRDEDKPEHVSDEPRVAPPVDVFENQDELLVVADVPGVNKDSLDVRLDAGELTFEARQTKPEDSNDSFQPIVFTRTFTVPNTVDPEKVAASLEAGVLFVHLPKSEAAKPRRIAVTSG